MFLRADSHELKMKLAAREIQRYRSGNLLSWTKVHGTLLQFDELIVFYY